MKHLHFVGLSGSFEYFTWKKNENKMEALRKMHYSSKSEEEQNGI